MGIHYDYKNTRGAKKLQKQHEREQRRLSKKARPMPEQSGAGGRQRSARWESAMVGRLPLSQTTGGG